MFFLNKLGLLLFDEGIGYSFHLYTVGGNDIENEGTQLFLPYVCINICELFIASSFYC